jgi:outer membrane protein, heavy metal efflux system
LKNGARYELFRIIGLEPEEQQYGITYRDTLAWFDPGISQESILQQVDFSAEMNMVRSNTESADRNISVAKSSYLPDLRVNYYKQDFGAGFRFLWFRNRYFNSPMVWMEPE